MYAYGRRRLHLVGGRRRRMRGRGVMDFLKKAHNFVKANQLISKGATALAPIVASRLGPTASGILSKVGSVAGSLGYGRRRRMHRGRGVHLAGGALRLAGL